MANDVHPPSDPQGLLQWLQSYWPFIPSVALAVWTAWKELFARRDKREETHEAREQREQERLDELNEKSVARLEAEIKRKDDRILVLETALARALGVKPEFVRDPEAASQKPGRAEG